VARGALPVPLVLKQVLAPSPAAPWPYPTSAHALLRRTRGERGSPRVDPCLPPFDKRQPTLWRAFFLRLAMRFCSASTRNTLMCEYYGDLVGD